MNRHAIAVMTASLIGTATLDRAAAQSAKDLEGTWRLVSSVVERDGNRADQFGPNPRGMMTLDAGGRFMLTIIGAGLPKFASNNRATGTAEENKAVIAKSIALFGSYAMNPAEKAIILKIDSATFPNWNGAEQKRMIATLNGDELKYVTPSASGGGVGTVTWKRAK